MLIGMVAAWLLSDVWSKVFVVFRDVLIHALPNSLVSADSVTQIIEFVVVSETGHELIAGIRIPFWMLEGEQRNGSLESISSVFRTDATISINKKRIRRISWPIGLKWITKPSVVNHALKPI